MINKIHLYDKIISPVITEKSTNLSEQNKIVFKINRNANKKNVKKSKIIQESSKKRKKHAKSFKKRPKSNPHNFNFKI